MIAAGFVLAGVALWLLVLVAADGRRPRRLSETFPTVDADPLPRDQLPPIPPVLFVDRPRLCPDAHPSPPLPCRGQ